MIQKTALLLMLAVPRAWSACDAQRSTLALEKDCTALCETGGYYDMNADPHRKIALAQARTCIYSEPWIRSISAQRSMGSWAVPFLNKETGMATMAVASSDAQAREWLELFKRSLVDYARARLERGEGERFDHARVAAQFGPLLAAIGRRPEEFIPELRVPEVRDAVIAVPARALLVAENIPLRTPELAPGIVPLDRGPYPVVPEVRGYQRLFAALGVRMKVDGKPGPDTKKAVIALQQRHPELGRADGVIDAATAAALVREFQEKFKDKYKLQPTGVLDAPTAAALRKADAARLGRDPGGFEAASIRIAVGPLKRGRLDVDTDGVRSGKCRFHDPHHDDGTSWRFEGNGSLDPCIDRFFVSPNGEDLGRFACATIGDVKVCGIIGDIGPAYSEASLAVHEAFGNGARARSNLRLVAPVAITLFDQRLRTRSWDRAEFESQLREFEAWYLGAGR